MTRYARYKKSFNAETLAETDGTDPAPKVEGGASEDLIALGKHADPKTKARMHFLARKQRRGDGLTAAERREVDECKKQSLAALRISKMHREKRRCLRCRQRGHSVNECPAAATEDAAAAPDAAAKDVPDSISAKGAAPKTVCYNCGSAEHSLRDCGQQRTARLSFASCFVCGTQGHISRDCSDNPRGIYPNGGGCRFCGSNRHLARDCMRGRDVDVEGTGRGEQMVGTAGAGDEDHVHAALRNIDAERVTNSKRRHAKTSSGKVISF